MKEIRTGVPQGGVLCPVIVCTWVTPQLENNTIATITDDTAKTAVENNNIVSTKKSWTVSYTKVQQNDTKSIHVDFTNKRLEQIPMNMNDQRKP